MKIPSLSVRIMVQLFCLLGIMSCATRKATLDTAPSNNHGKPVAGDMKSMEEAKEKM